MEPNPLLPSFLDLLQIVGIAMAVIVLLGVVFGVWLSNRSRTRRVETRRFSEGGMPECFLQGADE
ncbi:hypothetical protein [uncultured Microbacterium sp.]|uniref:hypothetical protein n=1 Tax=uncultured Microbacterium sp. TaxID=191216 RepID=UPI0025EE912C|nr:hypothetical protein [uncultured Microbacterium sp.]